jgi:hypothetical protein
MFNSHARIERVTFGAGREAWIVDDALHDPEALRRVAIKGRGNFAAAPFNAYPGLEWRMGADVDEPLSDFFALRLRAALGGRRTRSMYSRLSLATLQPHELRPLQRLCHRDRFGTGADELVAACTLYLFDDPRLGGTAFFNPKCPLPEIDARIRHWNSLTDEAFSADIGAAPAYLIDSNAWFECIGVVPARFNRAVFYDGSGFHSSHIAWPERLSADPAQGRLTLNGFFVCRRSLVR